MLPVKSISHLIVEARHRIVSTIEAAYSLFNTARANGENIAFGSLRTHYIVPGESDTIHVPVT